MAPIDKVFRKRAVALAAVDVGTVVALRSFLGECVLRGFEPILTDSTFEPSRQKDLALASDEGNLIGVPFSVGLWVERYPMLISKLVLETLQARY